ncbi:2'-5' RNA ligase [Catalinimonas alkaloidigena]|uniref:2'-5' RNA ligase family protein n=1 Tax=Catalinimonas alkaloidigena TaxID=1075417 RepID=UPI002405F4DE|nr:mutarotase [Catalinimonas alkaloidigena]MDF9795186.1 2'-5' RNA ligase [Catalinimonas alkaloidigena]
MNQALSEHYTQMWTKARNSFLEGNQQTDTLLDEPGDDRYGITLLLRPDNATAQNINAFLDEIAQVEPHQYYYPLSDQHMTILSIISCYSGFELEDIDVLAYNKLIQKALDGIPPIKILFKGVTASPSTVLIQGFPEDGALERLRDQLREVFKSSELQHSIDSRYRLFTAHSTVIRFREPLLNPQKFIDSLEKYREADFGLVTARQLELLGNDWYQREAKVKLLKTFTLSAAR